MLNVIRYKEYENGIVYAMETEDGYKIEVADTFLPLYTKFAVGNKRVRSLDIERGSRYDRWIIGVSCMSGCRVHCRMCATGSMKKGRNLTAEEILQQVDFVLNNNSEINPAECKEFKIEYTCMGEPFLNIEEVRKAIDTLDRKYVNSSGKPFTHHYISTIGVKGSDFSWIKENMTLQISLHSLEQYRRDNLISFKHKLSLAGLGAIRTQSKLKTTLNMTLESTDDFDIDVLKRYFSKEHFFIKLSPIYPNEIADRNKLGSGIVSGNILYSSPCISDIKSGKMQSIIEQLEDAGYDYALAVATQAEIQAGAACGQLSILEE